MNTFQVANLELANGTLISRTNTWFYLKLFFLVVLFCSVEFLRAWQLHGFTRAESAFVEGARDMLMHKQYIAPLFHGLPYFDKPPLHYWLLIFFYKMFGVSLPIARILSIAAGASSLVATSILVRNILGEKSALLAAMILATTVGFYELGSTAMPDMLLCSLSIIAVIFAYKIFFDTPKRRSDCLFIMSAAFALAWMTKGPIAILIPAFSFSIYSVAIKQLPRVSVKELIFILVIFLIIVAPWHIALYSHYGLPAFDWLYLRGNVKRFVGLDPA